MITKKDIALQPGEAYRVNMLLGSESPENKPVINIHSRTGKNSQHYIKDFDIKQEITKITTTFTSTEDIEDGTQWIRIHIPENTQDAVLIKGMEIWLE